MTIGIFRAHGPSKLVVLASRSMSYQSQLANAVENVNAMLETSDRSSYLLSQYIPEPARNTFIAIRAFALEINKISVGGRADGRAVGASNQLRQSLGVTTADMKFRFWDELMTKAFTDVGALNEPVAFLIRDGIRQGLNLDISYFHQFLQTRRHFLNNNRLASVSDICSYGEGTYSQLNYATQALLLSPQISPSVIHMLELSAPLQDNVSEIAAHIGQATAISSMIIGMNFYASAMDRVTLPVDIMTKYELSQEAVLRLAQGHVSEEKEIHMTREKLKNVVFDSAVTANDHLISARTKMKSLKREISDLSRQRPKDTLITKTSSRWRGGIPDVLFVPFMLAIPTSLYLQRLERNDFDVYSKKLQDKEWRLAWASFKSYYTRNI